LQNLPSSSNTHDSEAHVKAFPVGTSFLPDPAKRVPLQWGVPVSFAIGPTRETCPPPAAKLTPSQELKEKVARAALACDAPGFDLGFDSPQKPKKECSSRPTTPVLSEVTEIFHNGQHIVIIDDDEWDEETWKEACDIVGHVEREKGYTNIESFDVKEEKDPESGFQTPPRGEASTAIKSQPSGSTTAADRSQAQQHRIIREPINLRSSYVMYNDKSLFTCLDDVKEVYNAVTAHGRRSLRGQDVDDTPIVVSHDKYFVSLRELANSMMPCGVLRNTIMELGIESIMLRKDRKIKKLVMPLRVAVRNTNTPFFPITFVSFSHFWGLFLI
jgi:hypothetical protein